MTTEAQILIYNKVRFTVATPSTPFIDIQYSTILYYKVLLYTVLYSTVLCCTVQYGTALYCYYSTVMNCTWIFYTEFYNILHGSTLKYSTKLYGVEHLPEKFWFFYKINIYIHKLLGFPTSVHQICTKYTINQ